MSKKKTAKPAAKKAPVKKTAPPVKRTPAKKIAAPVENMHAEATSAPPKAEYQEPKAMGPGILFRITFPQGDGVTLVFDARGTSAGKNITKVIVSQDGVEVAGVTWTEKQAPMGPTGAWIVTVTMPDGSTGTFDIGISDNLGQGDTGSFILP